jgi:tetratricopeptide (TPR) repeat protein
MTATVTAEQHRQKGNICFERKQYEEALCHYTEAIKLDPNNHIYYSNRSSCYYYLKKYEYALEDAYKSIQLCPSWSKVSFRRLSEHFVTKFYVFIYSKSFTNIFSH